MHIRVLGSAAGGGFPQWNCNCRNCDGVRRGGIRARPRTQSSIAVSADGAEWVLFNASPDVLAQVKAARVTADYDTQYGANTGPWTTDMFVEAVYNSLKSAR